VRERERGGGGGGGGEREGGDREGEIYFWEGRRQAKEWVSLSLCRSTIRLLDVLFLFPSSAFPLNYVYITLQYIYTYLYIYPLQYIYRQRERERERVG
jgi:hypothetical protein